MPVPHLSLGWLPRVEHRSSRQFGVSSLVISCAPAPPRRSARGPSHLRKPTERALSIIARFASVLRRILFSIAACGDHFLRDQAAADHACERLAPRPLLLLPPSTMPARGGEAEVAGSIRSSDRLRTGDRSRKMIFTVPFRELRVPRLVSHPGLDLQSSQTS